MTNGRQLSSNICSSGKNAGRNTIRLEKEKTKCVIVDRNLARGQQGSNRLSAVVFLSHIMRHLDTELPEIVRFFRTCYDSLYPANSVVS